MDKNFEDWNGTSFHNGLVKSTYQDLVSKLGEPDEIGSGDNKVQVEWLLKTDDGTPFTIYDWKNYDTDIINSTETIAFHIGHHNAIELKKIIAYLGTLNVKATEFKFPF